jgi:hypothetical protein
MPRHEQGQDAVPGWAVALLIGLAVLVLWWLVEGILG